MIVFLAMVSLSVLLGTQIVFAGISDELPNPSDMTAGDKTGALDLHLKNLSVAQVLQNKMAAYYPNWDTSANGKQLKITDGIKGRVCHVNESQVSGNITIRIRVANNVVNHTIPIDKVCDTGQFYGNTFNFPNGTLIDDPGSQKRMAEITVFFNTSPRLPAGSGNDLNYRMVLKGDNVANGKLALTKNDSAQEFGLRSAYDDDPNQAPNKHVRASVPFGYPCYRDVGPAGVRQVKLYDADTVFGDTYMWVERNGSKLDRNEYDESDFRNIQRWDADHKRWKLSGSNRDNNRLTIKTSAIVRGDSYELVVYNAGTNVDGVGGSYNAFSPHYNTLSVGIPEDSIYANGNCNYSLRPALSVSPSTYSYYPNLTVNAVINKTGSGPVPEAHPWQIFAVRYNGEPATRNLRNDYVGNGVNPCGGNVLPAGGIGCTKIADRTYAAQPSHSINPYTGGGPDSPGTRLCFFARIQNPTHLTTDDTDWSYSDLSCATSGITPKLRVTGHDLKVGNLVDTSLSYQAPTAQSYGSWGEYGVFSNGTNTNMASGSGLLGGGPNSQLFWSALTFANNGVYGRYGGVLPPSYNPGMGTAIGNILGATTFGEGDKRVLRYNGTLYITGNLTYDNDGADNNGYNSIKGIPEVKIVADNIIVAPTVTQIDPWLVALNTTGTYGRLSTCGTSPGVPTPGVAGFQAFSTSGLLNSGMCQNELKFNGYVVADQLYAYRTKDAPGDAWAENFDLRASNFLSAYAGVNTDRPVARTELITEQPPRF